MSAPKKILVPRIALAQNILTFGESSVGSVGTCVLQLLQHGQGAIFCPTKLFTLKESSGRGQLTIPGFVFQRFLRFTHQSHGP